MIDFPYWIGYYWHWTRPVTIPVWFGVEVVS